MAKIVSKKNKLYTLMFIPHAKEKVSRWQIPLWLIHLILSFLGVIFIMIAYFSYSYYQLVHEVQEIELIKQLAEERQGQIVQLEAKIEELNDKTLNMQAKLTEVKELEVVVREMVGLKQKEEVRDFEPRIQAISASRGGGQALTSDNIIKNLETIDEVIGSTTEDLGQLVEDVGKRLEYLEAVPSRMPVNGRLTSGFGMRKSPFGAGREFHNGIDLAAAKGTVVKAAGKGKVIFASWRSGYGNTVILDHGFGFKSLYAHNSSLKVKVGQWVEPNQIIAMVGSTGRSTGPHLHFTIEVNGKAVNPLNYLK